MAGGESNASKYGLNDSQSALGSPDLISEFLKSTDANGLDPNSVNKLKVFTDRAGKVQGYTSGSVDSFGRPMAEALSPTNNIASIYQQWLQKRNSANDQNAAFREMMNAQPGRGGTLLTPQTAASRNVLGL